MPIFPCSSTPNIYESNSTTDPIYIHAKLQNPVYVAYITDLASNSTSVIGVYKCASNAFLNLAYELIQQGRILCDEGMELELTKFNVMNKEGIDIYKKGNLNDLTKNMIIVKDAEVLHNLILRSNDTYYNRYDGWTCHVQAAEMEPEHL